jgi:hypothetical protein
MLSNYRLADLRVTTAQQRSTGQNLPSDLYGTGMYCSVITEAFYRVTTMKEIDTFYVL